MFPGSKLQGMAVFLDHWTGEVDPSQSQNQFLPESCAGTVDGVSWPRRKRQVVTMSTMQCLEYDWVVSGLFTVSTPAEYIVAEIPFTMSKPWGLSLLPNCCS